MLEFKETFILYEDQLLTDAAVFTIFSTSLHVLPFKQQHFKPTATRLVITEADPLTRTVQEINGENAVQAYAEAISVPTNQLDALTFSHNPLMLKLFDDYYIRAIAGIKDNALRFYCAIDKGLVLSIGHSNLSQDCMEKELKKIEDTVGKIILILGCDCILRRLDLAARGILDPVGQVMANYRVFGFSTYGEQFNSVHVNQTFTGIAIAE